MTTLEIIKDLCKKEGIKISTLEKEMGYGNGSLSKANKIPSDRILDLSKRFNVSMEYLMTGEDNFDTDSARDESERKLLMLCRNATKANPEDKEALVETFESTIDMYLKAKGLK